MKVKKQPVFTISRRADYGVRIMLELGKVGCDQCIPTSELARRTGVPKAFLHKIGADLAKVGLVRAYVGPRGGLALVRPPSTINLQQILEAVDDRICFNICLLRPHECPRDRICPAHSFWGRIQLMMIRQLQATTLHKLLEEAQVLEVNGRTEAIPYVFEE